MRAPCQGTASVVIELSRRSNALVVGDGHCCGLRVNNIEQPRQSDLQARGAVGERRASSGRHGRDLQTGGTATIRVLGEPLYVAYYF
jgi:hypothetical protein